MSEAETGFDFLGMGDDWHPIAGMDGMVALASIYVPLDGMNEKVLCISDLIEIDGSTEVPDTDKADLTIVAAIRLVLDYAKDTEEAVKLLSEYDVFSSVNAAHHLAISDINNHNVVVEWKNGQMRVTETDIVTNHCLAEPLESPMTGESYRRFAKLTEMHSGFKTQEEETLWSVIYNKEELSSTIYFDRKWDEPLSFSIEE